MSLMSAAQGNMDVQPVDIHNKICRIFLLPCPRSDQHVTSPYDIHTFSGKRLMRILKLTFSRSIPHYILTYLLYPSSGQLLQFGQCNSLH